MGRVYFCVMKRTEFEKGHIAGGRYEVIKPVGEGGTSRVYLVADRHIGRTLAMKVMDRSALGAFTFAKSEIESLRCVRFPLFPAIHDAFCDDSYIYILSEYVKGVPLPRMLANGGLPRSRSLALAERICEALKYLHCLKRPILYLDLKPDNIIIDDEGLPHLIDFGIAGWLAAKHIPVGTVGYSPPEQYRTDGGMDARSDIFAFGMTYYAIRCGKPPDPDPDTAIRNIKDSKILGSSEQSFLARCCAPDKEDRYPCVGDVLKQIRHIRSTPKRIRKKIVTAAVTTGVAAAGFYIYTGCANIIRQNEAAAQLALRATDNMKEGEYTPEGIRIIKASIGTGMLPHDCEQEFIFEVATNMMLVSKDYRGAASYFARLDKERFPEAEEYMKLCRLQTGFDHDPEEALSLTGKLFANIMQRAPSTMKYENMIFIAGCYEEYETDAAEGLIKALSVLGIAKQEMEALMQDSTKEDMRQMMARIDEMCAAKEERLRIIKTNRTGEMYEHKEQDI